MRTCIVLVSMVLAGTAHAEPETKVATTLSVGGTLVPVAGVVSSFAVSPRASKLVFVASTVALALAPSAGPLYAGDRWTTGLTVRLAGGALVAIGSLSFSRCAASSDDDRDDWHDFEVLDCATKHGVVVALGFATMLFGAGQDIARAKSSTRMLVVGGSF